MRRRWKWLSFYHGSLDTGAAPSRANNLVLAGLSFSPLIVVIPPDCLRRQRTVRTQRTKKETAPRRDLVSQLHHRLLPSRNEPELLKPVERCRLAHIEFLSNIANEFLARTSTNTIVTGLEAAVRET